MFHRIIFLVADCSFSLFRCAGCFQPYLNIACRRTQGAARIKRTHIDKNLNKISIFIKSLLYWSVNLVLSMFFQTPDSSLWLLALVKSENHLGVVYSVGDFENFSKVSAESPLLPCVPHRSRLFLLDSPDMAWLLKLRVLYSHKARFLNQLEYALYLNFTHRVECPVTSGNLTG